MYIKTYFKAKSQYRVGFFLGTFSNFYCYFITYCTYWALIQGTGNIAGWDFADLSMLYGVSLLTYSISGTLVWYSVYHLEEIIISGQLDIFLLRPANLLHQLIWQRFGDTFIGQIIVTLFFLGFAIYEKNSYFTPFKVIYFTVCIISGILIQLAAMILVGSISFWTLKSSSIGKIFYYDIRKMTQYPLIIYPKFIQYLLTFILPWGFINYYPVTFLLEKNTEYTSNVLTFAPLVVGILFLSIALNVFRKGVNHYSGVGS